MALLKRVPLAAETQYLSPSPFSGGLRGSQKSLIGEMKDEDGGETQNAEKKKMKGALELKEPNITASVSLHTWFTDLLQ